MADQVLGIGSYFSSELEKLCAARIPLKMTGPASMPYPFISGDESLLRSKSFVNIVRQKDFIFTRIIIGFSEACTLRSI